MNTYRAYVLDTKVATEPKVSITYIRADKYGPAWQGARAALNGEEGAPKLFTDEKCTIEAKLGHGDHLVVAKIADMKPRNVKLDTAALKAILADPKTSAEDKLKAATALVG